MRYRPGTGFLAFVLHRGGGIILTLFLLPHLFILYFLKDPATYEAIRSFCARPAVSLTETGLLALVLAHGLNGIRIILLEGGAPSRFQKILFWAASAIGLFVFFAGARLMITAPTMIIK